MTIDKYRQGNRDIIYLIDRFKNPIPLKDAMAFLASDDPKTKQLPNYREKLDHLPSKQFYIPIDRERILETNTIREARADKIVDQINWNINRNYITKSDMMVLDLLATNNWERPVYFAITVSRENYLQLENYFQVEGLAYRVVPVYSKFDDGQTGGIDTEIMYDNLMNKFKWGGIQNPKVYLDENNLRMLSNMRNSFSRLAEALLAEGKIDSARNVLDRSIEVLPNNRVPYNFFSIPVAESYYRINDTEKANDIVKQLSDILLDELGYYLNLEPRYSSSLDYEKRLNLHMLQELIRITGEYNQEDISKDLEEKFQQLVVLYSPQGQ